MANMNQESEQVLFKEEEKRLATTVTAEDNQNKKYRVRRREVPKTSNRQNDIYIGDKSNFRSQVEKCKNLLDTKFNEVFLHGLGDVIPRAMNVALDVKNFYQGTVDFSTNTSTVKLIDDLIPLDEQTPASYKTRVVSSVDIHIFRSVKIPN